MAHMQQPIIFSRFNAATATSNEFPRSIRSSLICTSNPKSYTAAWPNSKLTGVNNHWWSLKLDGASIASASLNRPHNLHRFLVTLRHLTENDMFAVKPAGDDSGDEEL
jgi:hypothetical protein